MQTEDDLSGQGSEGTEGEQGTPPAAANANERIERLERENAQHRAEIRRINAEKLGSEHGLPASVVGLISDLPKDQQEAKAKELAEDWKAHPSNQAQATEGSTEQAAGQTTEGQTQQQPTPEEQAAQGMSQTGSAPQVQPAAGGQSDLQQRLQGAKSLEEVEAIQNEMRQAQRGGG